MPVLRIKDAEGTDRWLQVYGGTGAENDPWTMGHHEANSDDILTAVEAINTFISDDNNPFKNVQLLAGEAFIGAVGGRTKQIAADFARPSNTTSYDAKDVVSTSTSAPAVITFTDAVRTNGNSGYITQALLMTDRKTAVQEFRLHLFSTTPTLINDADPFLLRWTDKDRYLGSIQFPALSTEDSTNSTAASAMTSNLRLAIQADASTDNIYGILETLTAYSATSGQNFHIRLMVEQN